MASHDAAGNAYLTVSRGVARVAAGGAGAGAAGGGGGVHRAVIDRLGARLRRRHGPGRARHHWHQRRRRRRRQRRRQGLTLVHFSAQPEPFLTHKYTLTTPYYSLKPPERLLITPKRNPIPQEALTLKRKLDKCKPLGGGSGGGTVTLMGNFDTCGMIFANSGTACPKP